MRIYLTHCSAAKDTSLVGSDLKVTPDRLYTSKKIKAFMDSCKSKGVRWAILSDKYGVWFPCEQHKWYDKPPRTVTDAEFKNLIKNFEQRLGEFDEIWFYHNPSRFSKVYKRLLKEASVGGKIILFTHVDEII